MTLPFLISVPHAGLAVPPEVQHLNLLSDEEVKADGDQGANEIYDLESQVSAFVTTSVARAYVDVNRAEDDRRKDGVVKTHTCWDVQIYRESLSEDLVQALLKKYYRPYHEKLSSLSDPESVLLGIDCHTMAVFGPPVGPDPGRERPLICLSNADHTCPSHWLTSLAQTLEEAFQTSVSLNSPFRGGYIIRSHARELPWVQLEFSRVITPSNPQKRDKLLHAIRQWCDSNAKSKK